MAKTSARGSRPALYVLAGVNGAGKSSVGGHLLERAGLAWFNPDSFARELMAAIGCTQSEANAAAWQEGLRRLDDAVANGRNHAFETTLGGHTIPARIAAAARSHDVLMWFCGLDSPERHIARVRARVAAGGHDIPEARIRERYPAALHNLILLLPALACLQVYDNSAEAAPGTPIPDPRLVLQMADGHVQKPRDVVSMRRTPGWAKPVVEAALALEEAGARGEA
jgi:predicted ABC-type ATPase